MLSPQSQVRIGKAGLVIGAGITAILAVNLCNNYPVISLVFGCGTVWLLMTASWWRPLTVEERKQLRLRKR